MKHKFFTGVAVVTMFALLITLSGCFGSFNLVKKVYKFNEGLGGKWVQEIGFIVMSVVPIYSGAAFIDAVILNTIEFWSGKNPVASTVKSSDSNIQLSFNNDGSIKYIQEDTEYIFEKSSDGTIVKDKEGQFVCLCQALDDGGIVLKDINGKTITSYSSEQVQNLYSHFESVK